MLIPLPFHVYKPTQPNNFNSKRISLFISLIYHFLYCIMAPASFHQNFHTVVCVMDASGCLGSSLVHRLLQKGYTVHAAVQDYDCEFISSDGVYFNEKRLKVFQSDPFDYHSIMDALKGCSALFYTFEPPHDQPIYDEFMAEVEVKAAHNVLEACAQTDTVDKVVFASSATAVVWNDDRQSSSTIFDERQWSDTNFCRKFKLWHALSKTLAEKTAWVMAMDRGVNMVSINSGLLVGPDLTITNPYLKGAAEMYEDGVFVTVDLDFLVEAHIYVFEDGSTYGRYLCFNGVINCGEEAIKLANMLTQQSQSQSYEEGIRMIRPRISNTKLKNLMDDDIESGPHVA